MRLLLLGLLCLAGCHLALPLGAPDDGSMATEGRTPADGSPVDGDRGDTAPPPDVLLPGEAGSWDAAAAAGLVVHAGGSGTWKVGDLAVDAAGNLYLVGVLNGTVDLGNGTPVTTSNYDTFIVSYTGGGVYRWHRTFDGFGVDDPLAIATHGNNIYVTGRMNMSTDLGGGPTTFVGQEDAFLVSYTTANGYRWSKLLAGAGVEAGRAVAVSDAGEVYVAGTFDGTITASGVTLTPKGATDTFLASYTESGVYRWAKTLGGTGTVKASALAVDKNGDLYLAGSLSGSASVGGPTLTAAGTTDVIVASYAATGTHRWSARYGGPALQSAAALAADDKGWLYLSGSHHGGIDFGGGALASTGANDLFIASLTTSAGGYRWARSHGGPYYDYGNDLAADGSGNVLVTGSFYGSVDFGGGALVAPGNKPNMFVASYAGGDGAHRWSKGYGDDGYQGGKAVALDPAGRVYVAADFDGSVDVGGKTVTCHGLRDVLVMWLAP